MAKLLQPSFEHAAQAAAHLPESSASNCCSAGHRVQSADANQPPPKRARKPTNNSRAPQAMNVHSTARSVPAPTLARHALSGYSGSRSLWPHQHNMAVGQGSGRLCAAACPLYINGSTRSRPFTPHTHSPCAYTHKHPTPQKQRPTSQLGCCASGLLLLLQLLQGACAAALAA